MIGHGRPPIRFAARAVLVIASLAWACSWSTQTAAQLADPPAPSPAEMDESQENPREQLELRVRIAWGDGGLRRWRGSLRLSSGNFSRLIPQGLQADASASSFLRQGELVIQQLSPRHHDAVDVTIRAPRSAELIIDLASDGENTPAGSKTSLVRIPVSRLVDGTIEKVLNPLGNHRLLISRVPGDKLRVDLIQLDAAHPNNLTPSLVFRQGPSLRLSINPRETGLQPSAIHRCLVELRRAGSEKILFSASPGMAGLKSGAGIRIADQFIPLDQPAGVYNITIKVYQRKFGAGGLYPLLEVFDALKLERTIQLVIVSDTRQASSEPGWKQLFQLDPANPAWWYWMKQLPQFTMIPRWSQKPLDNGLSSVVTHRDRQWTKLGPGAWRTFPLPLAYQGELHELDIEIPNDHRQTLGISIIEPDETGRHVPIGVDSGVDIPSTRWAQQFQVQHHRLLFWPRTRGPMVLIMNKQVGRAALFGKITLRHRQGALAATAPAPRGRLVAACFEKPLFPENFGASETADPISSINLDDWQTFYQGGERLVAYLPYAGYNAAIIPVRCEGSTLYPSSLAPGTPKYESGAYFSSGQDPIRKDVLEMLFRQFDREGLRLVPAIQFNVPLPELEQQIRDNPGQAEGIQLVGRTGQPWTLTNPPVAGMAAYYNPTDSRVQSAMRKVVREITQRYGHHASFAGLAIQMTTNGYTQLPAHDAALDRQTRARFVQELTANNPPQAPVDPTTTRWRQRWLNWRCQQLAQLYRGMLKDIQAKRPDARLFLCPANLLDHPQVKSQLRPRLPQKGSLSGALLVLGIDPALLSSQPGLAWLEPSLSSPLINIQQQATQLVLKGPLQKSLEPAISADAGAQFFHSPQFQQLGGLGLPSPLAADNADTLLLATIPAAGDDARRRFVEALAKRDMQILVDGGWTLPLGQELQSRQLLQTFQQLPAQPFEDLQADQPVLVRQLRQRGEASIYLLNTAPWPIRVVLQITIPSTASLEPLDDRSGSTFKRIGQVVKWTVQLEPYDLHAAKLSTTGFSIDQIKVSYDDQVKRLLKQEIHDMNSLAKILERPKPIPLLSNPGFELNRVFMVPDNTRRRAVGSLVPVGWISNSAPDATADIEEVSSSKEGKRSLEMYRGPRSTDPLWIRSDSFPPPRSGRIAVSAWLRVSDRDQQPSLRISIEGKLDGKVYYRPHTVGRMEKGQAQMRTRPIGEDWTEFLLLVDNLPASGLSELRVGFDLMSQGQVWIDNIQIYDAWFQQSEQRELLRSIALAYSHRTHGQVADCEKFLQGYWARYLRQYVPNEEILVATAPAGEAKPVPVLSTSEDLWKRYLPSRLFPYLR